MQRQKKKNQSYSRYIKARRVCTFRVWRDNGTYISVDTECKINGSDRQAQINIDGMVVLF